jgi:DNA phosphorothioation-dependent restriction protein DptG
MKAMSRPEDNSFIPLQELSLDDIYNKADKYFIDFTSIEELIDAEECNLSEKITGFLKEWESITDVTAIQQNIHYELGVLDEAIGK